MIPSNFSLQNKYVLITGAAGLLGYEHALALLEVGANIILTDVDMKRLEALTLNLKDLSDQGNVIISRYMDVSDKNSVLQVSGALKSQGLHVDILINNAAIDPKVTPGGGDFNNSRFENYSLDFLYKEISVGLIGAFLCSQIFGSEMAKMESGVILNIASDLSIFSPDQRIYRRHGIPDDMQPAKPVSYSIVKTGLIGLTRYLATYWADKNVRCNALSPGGVFNGQGDEFVKNLTSLIPLARMARRDEYRSAIQFLCSDASSYMNGQNLVIDGGRSVW